MKPNVFNSLVSSTTGLAFLFATASAQAQVTVYAQYRLGEAGSLGTSNIPQDSSGNAKHLTGHVGGTSTAATTTGVFASGSTHYLNTANTANLNEGFFGGPTTYTAAPALPTNDFAFGIYARVTSNSTATRGEIFTLGNLVNNTYKLSLDSSGWRASSQNIGFIGTAATVANDTWVHLAVIRSGGASAFYVDGTQVGGTLANAPTIGQPHLSINPGNAGSAFDGHLDELRIVTFPPGEPTANVLSALTTVYVPPIEPVGASGTWVSTVDGNWSLSSNWNAGVIATSPNNTATFSAGSGPIAVTLDSNRSIGNLVFSNADYTIGGTSILTLNSTVTPGISVASERIATLATSTVGTLGLEKTGLGTLILSGPSNSYSGGTTISAGTLQIGAGGTAGAIGSGNVTIATGAFLNFNRSNNVGTLTNQQFSGAGTLVKNGAGDLVFNGTSDHTGAQGLTNIVVNDGLIRTDFFGQWNSNLNLTVNGSGKFEMWNTSSTIGNLSGNGTVQSTKFFGRANTLTVAAGSFSGTITDSGITTGPANTGAGDTRINLVKSGAGTLTLSGVTSFTGTTTVTGGTLSLGNGATSTNLSDSATVSISSSIVDLNFAGTDIVGRLTLGGEVVPPGVYDSSLATPAAYRSYFTGTGSLTVLAQDGSWVSTADGNWGDSGNWTANVIATGFDKTATFSAGSGTIAVTLDSARAIGNLVFSNSDYTIAGTNLLTLDSSTIPGISVATDRIATLATIVGGSLGFEKTGLGTLVLNAPNNSYAGTTTITSGTLQIGGTGRLGGGNYASAISIASGSTLQYSSSAAQTLSGAITGDGGITKDTNNSDLTLSVGNSYSGTTTVSAGRILVSSGTHLSSGATSVVQSGTGQITVTGTGLTVSNSFNLSTKGYVEPGDATVINGAIRSNGNNTFSGTLTLSGDSRFGAFGTAPVNTISGRITGSGAMSFYGLSNTNNQVQTFILSNSLNDYTGDTQIDNDDFIASYNGNSTTLKLGASDVIPNGATAGLVAFNGVNINDLTVFDLNGFGETVNGLSSLAATGAIITNSATGASVLTIGANGTTSAFSGTVTDAGVGKTLAINKIGVGTLTFSGVNSYSGDTTVSGGTLELGNANASNQASTVTIASGGKLQLTFAATDTVEKLFIGSTQQVIGEYGHTDSGATNGGAGVGAMDAYFAAGTGRLDVTTGPASGFTAWQTANGTALAINLDHDNDGVSNGVEYFIGGTVLPAANTTGFTALPGVTPGSPRTVTWVKSANYPGIYDTDFRVETSQTLVGAWTPVLVGVGADTVQISGNNVTYTFSTGSVKKFARLVVTGP